MTEEQLQKAVYELGRIGIWADHCDKCDRAVFSARMALDTTKEGAGIFLCHPCWIDELVWRKKRNREVSYPFDLPDWPYSKKEGA